MEGHSTQIVQKLLNFRNILAAISASSIQAPVVVVGHHRNEIAARLNLPNMIFNPNYEQGMITSFQAGIRTLPPNITGSFLFLVDHPIVNSATIDTLIENFQPGCIVLPTFEKRRGNLQWRGRVPR